MCGIVGILGGRNVVQRLLGTLDALIYRGYDSAGVATVDHGQLRVVKSAGKVQDLRLLLEKKPLEGSVGIGHTRWATHGIPSSSNAHPHATSQVAVVHNGIIENHEDLRHDLIKSGCKFQSETDTEVIPHLVTHYLKQGLGPVEAAFKAIDHLEGAYSIVMIFEGHDDLMVGVCNETPLAIGEGQDGFIVCSDGAVLKSQVNHMGYLRDQDRFVIQSGKLRVQNPTLPPFKMHAVQGEAEAISKEGYDSFMEKEIMEQPQVLEGILNTYSQGSRILMPALEAASHITIVACGTSYFAGLTAKYWMEAMAQIPVSVEIASEYRYRTPYLHKDGLTLFISQSGETADTVAAMKYVQARGQKTMALVNVKESFLARTADEVVYLLAGVEIGVASTKAFTAQLMSLALMTLHLAKAKGIMTPAVYTEHMQDLKDLPQKLQVFLTTLQPIYKLATFLTNFDHALFLGRGPLFPVALEGALKLKELSYIHAEAYPAGEMKHGPIALIDDTMPVVVLASSGDLLEKTLSGVQEVLARGGRVILFTDRSGAAHAPKGVEEVIKLPQAGALGTPFLYTAACQVLSYATALAAGCNIDQPRNLAKSVTVE